ncbi:hypothetical protein [Photobacterium sanguinicancri]|uniref:hypothetical protein n=1 Tax=Photobacterium sanguinicancri TaxID=875932 RepID=UPI003D097182
MRKTNIALVVAVVMASPFALADEDNTQNANNVDVLVQDSFNKDATYDFDKSKSEYADIDGSGNVDIDKSYTSEYSKSKEVDYSGNQDNDLLYMSDIGNDESVVKTDNSDNSHMYYDNSQWDASKAVDIDIDIDHYLAESKLEGDVMGASVTYGGACCSEHGDKGYRGRGGSSEGSDSVVKVEQMNSMNDSFGGASGINIAGQNVGNNSLVQQTTSTNAALVGSQ